MVGLQWWGIGEWSAAPLVRASLCLKSTDVPNGYTAGVPNGFHGCTKWVPRVYQIRTTGVPNEHHGCTKWVPRVDQMGTTGVPNGYIPRVYQMGTTGVPYGYHGCIKWVPRVYQMRTTGVPHKYHGCTKWAPRVYQLGTTGVPNGYHWCTKWASGKRNGVAKRCWALWRCVFVCGARVKGGAPCLAPAVAQAGENAKAIQTP